MTQAAVAGSHPNVARYPQFELSRAQGHEQKAGAKLYGTLFERELQYKATGGAVVDSISSSLVTLDSNAGAIEGITIEASLKGDPTKKGRIDVDVDIGCHKLVAFVGADGTSARPHASNGPDVTAYVTKADLPKFKQITLVVATGGGQQQYGVIPPGHPVAIESVGGNGYVAGLRAGGNGGNGGNVHVIVDDRFADLAKLVKASSGGGTGGGGGVAGRNGGGGRGDVVVGDVMAALGGLHLPKSIVLSESAAHAAQPAPAAAPTPASSAKPGTRRPH